MKNKLKSKNIALVSVTIILVTGIGFALESKKQKTKSLPLKKEVVYDTKEDNKIDTKRNSCNLTDEERSLLYKKIDSHNNRNLKDAIYSNSEKGVSSINLGKYGFIENEDGTIGFGKLATGVPCPYLLTHYTLKFTEKRTAESILSDIKSKEFEDEFSGEKLKKIEHINDLEVFISESWGPMPTRKYRFEIPGEISNIVIETDLLIMVEQSDYDEIINSIKTLQFIGS